MVKNKAENGEKADLGGVCVGGGGALLSQPPQLSMIIHQNKSAASYVPAL